MITLQERVHSVELPEYWNLDKLHRILRVRKGIKNLGMREDNLLSLSYGKIVRKSINSNEGLLPESFENYQIVTPGNIVMRLTDLQNDKQSIRQGLVVERGIITSAYDALDVRKGHDPRFWAYTLLSIDVAKYYYSLGAGVRQSIKFADFPNDWIRTPSLDTQKAIAAFLDRETARIDLLIEKKQNALSLAQSLRSECVLNALKCGFGSLDYASDEGVLRFVDLNPAWRAVRVKHVSRHMTSGSRAWGDQVRDEGDLFLQSGCITTTMGVSTETAPRILPQTGAEAERTRVKANDVLVCITGGRTGAVGFVEALGETAYINQHVCLIRPDTKKFHSRLLAQILYSEIGQLQFSMSQYGLKQGLGFSEVANAVIPCPPRAGQDEIASAIDAALSRLDKMTAAVEQSISLLREYRAALITAAVTGQIDVATWGRDGRTERRLDQIEEATQP